MDTPRTSSAARASGGPGLARAAIHPLGLLCLVAGGVIGFKLWLPMAGLGAIAYGAVVARHLTRSGAAERSIPPPTLRSIAIRSTEVMAYLVRFRKGYEGAHHALSTGAPDVRALLAQSYGRLQRVADHACEVATRADHLRAHLDRTPSAKAVQKELEAAQAHLAITDPGLRKASLAEVQSLHDQLEARRRLELEYAQLTSLLAEICASIEGWQARVMRMNAEAPDAAEQASRDVAEELDRLEHHVRAFEEVARL